MTQYIDPSRITVIKDSDGTAQSNLAKVFDTTINSYYASNKGSMKKTKSVSVYFSLDKPIYLSSYEFDKSVASSAGNGYSMYIYAYSSSDFNTNGKFYIGGIHLSEYGSGNVSVAVSKERIKNINILNYKQVKDVKMHIKNMLMQE